MPPRYPLMCNLISLLPSIPTETNTPSALEVTRNPSTVPLRSVARAKFEISPFRTTVRAWGMVSVCAFGPMMAVPVPSPPNAKPPRSMVTP